MVAVLEVFPEKNAAREADVTPAQLRVLLLEAGSLHSSIANDLPALNGLRPVIETVSGEAAFREALREFRPDAVVAGLGDGAFGAPQALAVVRVELPGTALVVMAESVDDRAGICCVREADAVVLWSQRSELPGVVEAAVKLRRPLHKLSPRQLEVLRLVADGRSTREIGEQLGLSMKTVESHRGAVMKRLARHNVADLVRYAVRTGVVRD